MPKNPWTDPNPKPGDFDAELGALDQNAIETHEGDPQAELKLLVRVEGENVGRLERIAQARGKKPSEVLDDLIRAADRPAA